MSKRTKVEKMFSYYMRHRRRNSHLNQKDLAEITGMRRETIAAIESGVQRISLDQALKIANALDMNLGNLKGAV